MSIEKAFDRILKLPTYCLSSLETLPHYVAQHKLKYLIFDKDDTLVPHLSYQITDNRIKKVIDKLNKMNVKMCIVSNSVSAFKPLPTKSIYNIPIIPTYRKKPGNGLEVLLKLSQLHNNQNPISISSIGVVGDRMMTDIQLGNKMKVMTFLVKPLQPTTIKTHGFLLTYMRTTENILFKLSDLYYS